ncbi:hypothetical protein EUX98_g9286 [Antrodiella citrinella]|uniref:Uncharacterized protein n=1 Tax=Antrodiella citrinella TaxID=2447956 RepID=A0A4S4LVG8_9APHY|nr:hypothetical protein EUX98_g9286 [Antrodiella citrinella]
MVGEKAPSDAFADDPRNFSRSDLGLALNLDFHFDTSHLVPTRDSVAAGNRLEHAHLDLAFPFNVARDGYEGSFHATSEREVTVRLPGLLLDLGGCASDDAPPPFDSGFGAGKDKELDPKDEPPFDWGDSSVMWPDVHFEDSEWNTVAPPTPAESEVVAAVDDDAMAPTTPPAVVTSAAITVEGGRQDTFGHDEETLDAAASLESLRSSSCLSRITDDSLYSDPTSSTEEVDPSVSDATDGVAQLNLSAIPFSPGKILDSLQETTDLGWEIAGERAMNAALHASKPSEILLQSDIRPEVLTWQNPVSTTSPADAWGGPGGRGLHQFDTVLTALGVLRSVYVMDHRPPPPTVPMESILMDALSGLLLSRCDPEPGYRRALPPVSPKFLGDCLDAALTLQAFYLGLQHRVPTSFLTLDGIFVDAMSGIDMLRNADFKTITDEEDAARRVFAIRRFNPEVDTDQVRKIGGDVLTVDTPTIKAFVDKVRRRS